MADAANGKANPPPELYLLWQCEKFNCLPESGGYNDQDDPTMRRAGIFRTVYNFVARNRKGKKETINYADLSEDDQNIFNWLRELEIKF